MLMEGPQRPHQHKHPIQTMVSGIAIALCKESGCQLLMFMARGSLRPVMLVQGHEHITHGDRIEAL